jgi:hypothetical protein
VITNTPVDLLEFTRDLCTLIKHALDNWRSADVESRAEQITAANKAISKIESAKEEVRKSLNGLPERDRLFAEVQLQPILHEIFHKELAALRYKKYRLARPSGDNAE